ncbi:uncharacterized protein FIESC28_07677 [Fusarium coffeatum]|uniref:Uncharacterized protein n=1 Tax=Fusarium coffeatum TaxID=231269 RepID=A0A366RBB8_9HYPO|nr:uncharacterized protein FIESC28_07677 [Fusarium coffeatum]RBR14441.1 hypothetical protein FIESC28_07677 [Fusarium coffeatum]
MLTSPKKKPTPGSKEASDEKITATSTTATVSSSSHGPRSAVSRSRSSISSIISPQPAPAAGPRGQDAQDIFRQGIGGWLTTQKVELGKDDSKMIHVQLHIQIHAILNSLPRQGGHDLALMNGTTTAWNNRAF